jgi:hypothetical protein
MKPVVVTNYNNKMGNADLADNYTYHHTMARKRLKKYMKILCHLMDTCESTAYHMHGR